MKVKNRSKDLDEIQDDLKDPSKVVFEPDEDLPGLGQHYCILCCKHCADDATLEVHTKSRFHKKRAKDAAEEQYTKAEAEFGMGMTKEILPPAHGVKKDTEMAS